MTQEQKEIVAKVKESLKDLEGFTFRMTVSDRGFFQRVNLVFTSGKIDLTQRTPEVRNFLYNIIMKAEKKATFIYETGDYGSIYDFSVYPDVAKNYKIIS